jgi:hypothetical protein
MPGVGITVCNAVCAAATPAPYTRLATPGFHCMVEYMQGVPRNQLVDPMPDPGLKLGT